MKINDVRIEIQGNAREGVGQVLMGMVDEVRSKWVAVTMSPQQAEQVAEALKAGVDRAAILLGGSILSDVQANDIFGERGGCPILPKSEMPENVQKPVGQCQCGISQEEHDEILRRMEEGVGNPDPDPGYDDESGTC